MSTLEYAALCYLLGIPLIAFAALWQMYVVLSESYTLNRFQNSNKMIWVAVAMFFSFSIALYGFCPNARKKGIVFLLCGGTGVVLYGLAGWLKAHAMLGM